MRGIKWMGKEGEGRERNEGGWKSEGKNGLTDKRESRKRKINFGQMRGENCVHNQVDR